MRNTGEDWKLKRISFEEAYHPVTVYKYRSWDNQFHKTIITDQTVYFARPTSFEDPFDCKLQKRYDLMTDCNILAKYIEVSREDHPNLSREQHRDFVKYWVENSPLHDKNYVKQVMEQEFKDFDGQFGVLSLTPNPSNLTMWEKYSNEHRGFCVGFNFLEVHHFFGGGIPVQYYDVLPIINWNDPLELEIIKRIGSKDKKWEKEEEYRAHKFNHNLRLEENRIVKIPSSCYTHVIFGAIMPDHDRTEIIDVCKKNRLYVGFFEEVIVNGSTEIKLNKIIA